MPTEPVTVVTSWVVRGGREGAFERAAGEWLPAALTVPGCQGAYLLRPPGNRAYTAVVRFDSAAAWESSRESPASLAFSGRVREHLAAGPRVEVVTDPGAWLTLPGGTDPVPRWKDAVVTWVGVNVMTAALTVTLGPLVESWPWLVGLVTFNAGVVAGLTWVVMPVLSRLLGRWL